MLPRYSTYGGVEQFGYRLAKALAARGHSVDFICARQEAETSPGVRVLAVGRPPGSRFLKLLWYLIRAERAVRRGRYDLTLSLGKTWSQDISRMGGGPLSVFWEKSEQSLPPGWPRFSKSLRRRLSPVNLLSLLVERRQFTESSEVIAVSHLVRQWLLKAHPALKPERVSVVYNRPDLERFTAPSPDERDAARRFLAESHGLSLPEPESGRPDPVFIGTASTNFRLKGLEPLIRAVALLPGNACLLAAGGRDSMRYAALAKKLGLGGRVFFLGRVDDMPGFYRALDVFILPTYYDACSNAVLEALASGCRVISARDNGSAFFLDADSVLDDPGDAAAMAVGLRRAMLQGPPPAFAWPDTVESGLDAFVARLEERLAERLSCRTPGKNP